MPNSSSSRAQLRSAIEATYGATAAATGRRKVRMTGESLTPGFQFDKSKEIRSDRQTSDVILLGTSATGGFNFEAIYREYDEFFETALQNSFVAFGTGGVSPTLTTPTFAANTLTQTAGTSFDTIGLGQWVQIRGCTGAHVVNNGWWQTSLTVPATAAVITFEGTPFAQTGAAAGTVTISTSRLTNGTTLRSHNLEVEFADVAQFLTFLGMGLNKMTLSLTSGAIATGAFDFTGKGALAMTGSSNLAGADSGTYPTTYDVMNATSNVAKLLEAGAALSGVFVKSLSLDLDNALRAQMAIGNLGAVGLGNGSLTLTGKLSAYFANSTLFNKCMNSTGSSLAFGLADSSDLGAANGYMFTLPAIEYTNAQVVAGSLDQDVMVDMDFTAKLDTVSGKTILIDRMGAAAA